MESKFLTLDYFSKTDRNSRFDLFEITNNPDHQEYENLIIDLNSINKTELEKFVKENHIDDFITRYENKDQSRRVFYFSVLIIREIANARIEKLLSTEDRPDPYNFPNLEDLVVDNNFLTSINQFNFKHLNLIKGNFGYLLCPVLEELDSSYFILRAILKTAIDKSLIFKVRLDPFIEFPLKDFHPMQFKMLIHGKPLDWQRIVRLKRDDFGRWLNTERGYRFGYTDYVWSPKLFEVHFTCEELPSEQLEGLKISRYFHSVFKYETGEITHCDGAIRIYTNDELDQRKLFHIKDPEVRKVGKRLKIFQFDSNDNNGKELDQDTFCQLAMNFFVWNEDVENYFK